MNQRTRQRCSGSTRNTSQKPCSRRTVRASLGLFLPHQRRPHFFLTWWFQLLHCKAARGWKLLARSWRKTKRCEQWLTLRECHKAQAAPLYPVAAQEIFPHWLLRVTPRVHSEKHMVNRCTHFRWLSVTKRTRRFRTHSTLLTWVRSLSPLQTDA